MGKITKGQDMPPANPAQKLRTAPFEDLVVMLLKQFQRLMRDRGTNTTSDDLNNIGKAASIKSDDYPSITDDICQHLETFVQESIEELQRRFGWTFAQSLAEDMSTITNWETTSDFIDIANNKSNAELRISAGATLLVMLEQDDYAPYLLDVIDADKGAQDVDAMLAMRALAHLDNSDMSAKGWYERQIEKYRG
jgi:hypothetical protein